MTASLLLEGGGEVCRVLGRLMAETLTKSHRSRPTQVLAVVGALTALASVVVTALLY
jgi:hypothetical protein